MFTKRDIPKFILLFLGLCAAAALIALAMYLLAPLFIIAIGFFPCLIAALKNGANVN